jgi:hypothetical protein
MSSSKPRARKFKVVCIQWGDAFIDPKDFTEEEAKETEPVYRKTVGFLIAKNQHGYILSTDVYDNDPEIAGKMFIPKGMAVKVTQLWPL